MGVKVLLLKRYAGPLGNFPSGRTIEVPEGEVAGLVAAGACEPISGMRPYVSPESVVRSLEEGKAKADAQGVKDGEFPEDYTMYVVLQEIQLPTEEGAEPGEILAVGSEVGMSAADAQDWIEAGLIELAPEKEAPKKDAPKPSKKETATDKGAAKRETATEK